MNVLKKYMITASVLLATTAGCGITHSGGHQLANGTTSTSTSISNGSHGSSTGSNSSCNNDSSCNNGLS